MSKFMANSDQCREYCVTRNMDKWEERHLGKFSNNKHTIRLIYKFII